MHNTLWLACIFFVLFTGAYRNRTPPVPTPQDSKKHTQKLNLQGNQRISSFRYAKKLAKNIYQDMQVSFYCGCSYSKNQIFFGSCGFEPEKLSRRSKRIEWEHVVPASHFGQSFASWRKGHKDCVSKGRPFKGRRCARLVSKVFRKMEADLYNLVPAIGEVNAKRSHYPMGLLPSSPKNFGSCMTKIDSKTIEPREEVRGFVARTYFYMDANYPGHGIISRKNRRLFEVWNRRYPPDQKEIQRAERIEKRQGNKNNFLY